MKIELTGIYNNKPYYMIRHDDEKINHSFGYEQTKNYIEAARTKGEKIEFEDTKFLDEHNKLIELIKSIKIVRVSLHKQNDEKTK